MRICSTASLVAAGPAKYAAGIARQRARQQERDDHDPDQRRDRKHQPLADHGQHGAADLTALHQRAIIEAAVEPVLIARDVLLHRDVDEGLIQRDARDVGEGEIDEALHVGVVGRGVAGRGGGARAVDQLVHLRRLVAHGVEDGIVAVIAPVEEVFGVIEPAREHVGVERHLLLVQFGAPVGAGDLVDRGLDADLGEALLHQHAERLVDAGEIRGRTKSWSRNRWR